MKFVDPLALKTRTPNQSVLFAGSQLVGTKTQEDFFVNFNDECVIVADGLDATPHAKVAAELASETAIWGYKHIRKRPFYWADKKLFLKRIFRSVNLTLWQKRKEYGFEQGLASTLSVVMIGTHALWAGAVGSTGIVLFREGLIDLLTKPDVDELGRTTNWLGHKRLGIVPHIAVEKFIPGDIVLVATAAVLHNVSEDQLRATFEVSGDSVDSLTTAVVHLLTTARENGGEGNLTACMIKKVRTKE